MTWSSPAEIADAQWADLAPAFDELLARPLDPSSLDAWLADWSRLEEILTEAVATAMIAYTCDTADPAKEAAHRRFCVDIAPKAEEKSVKLAERFARLGSDRADLGQTLARFRRAVEIFREENVPLTAELEATGTEYQRITGGLLADWEGEKRPLPQLAPFLESPDRAVRERAFRAATAPYLEVRGRLAALFDRQFELRQELARNAGFRDFQGYAFAAKCRFDYGPEDCARFQDAVEEVVVPAVARLHHRRRDRLGVERLRPWDLAVSLHRGEPLRPYATGAELEGKAARLFQRLDPTLAGQFRIMVEERLLDLESRKGKAPGGYCDTLHFRGRPFIFMNGVGVMEDVQTLLHECGHAFHAFASDAQPLIWQRHPSAESAELASMSMELLAAPLLDAPGAFLATRDAATARLEHLEDILIALGHIASVDGFQSWLYTSGAGGDGEARDAAWLRIRSRFEPVVDWSDLTAERIARWYRQIHIFLYPFYYIEYGIAQLGALQVWLRHRRDPERALADYRRFLALGATQSLPELYRAAGARLIFDREGILPLVGAVEEEADRLRGQLG
jgi:oligoendopeptidase F